MTAQVVRQRDGRTVVDFEDGCQPGNHRRDALCSRTPLKTLTQAEPEPDDEREGGAT